MLYLAIAITILIIILILIFVIRINVVVEYVRNEWDDHFILAFFTFGGIIKYKYEISLIDIEKTGLKFTKVKEKGKDEKDVDKKTEITKFFEILDQLGYLQENYQRHRNIICKIRNYLSSRLIFKEFLLDMDIGTGDAFYTGILSGLMWTLSGVVYSYLSNNFKIINKCVDIKTKFMEKMFKVDFYCIFRIRIVHIIVIGLMLLIEYIKRNIIPKRFIAANYK